MTDEQLKVAPRSVAVERMLELYKGREYDTHYPPDGELTQNIIAALQSDGQYIVFQAPVGYRFGGPRELVSEDYFPDFSVLTQKVNLVPAGGCVGLTVVTLEPLTGGVE